MMPAYLLEAAGPGFILSVECCRFCTRICAEGFGLKFTRLALGGSKVVDHQIQMLMFKNMTVETTPKFEVFFLQGPFRASMFSGRGQVIRT